MCKLVHNALTRPVMWWVLQREQADIIASHSRLLLVQCVRRLAMRAACSRAWRWRGKGDTRGKVPPVGQKHSSAQAAYWAAAMSS